MAGRAQTVCGPVHPAELGQTLAHEHLLIDLSWSRDP
jgi:predicted metal-dependent phosphotriesterase family hydrolase